MTKKCKQCKNKRLKPKQKRFCSVKCCSDWSKGKTAEERYGKVTANKLNKLLKRSYEEKFGKLKSEKIKTLLRRPFEERFGIKTSNKIKCALRNLRKDKTYKELYGKEKSKIVSQKIRDTMKEKCKWWIGKTLEEIYGEETARKVRTRLSVWHNKVRGKTYEELFGKTKAQEIIKSVSGKNSHAWLGGISFEPYDLSFNKQLKKTVSKRDNHTCQSCGKKIHKGTCHHIHYNKKDSRLETLVWTCLSCNIKANTNRDYWLAYFCYKKGIECEDLLNNIKHFEKTAQEA